MKEKSKEIAIFYLFDLQTVVLSLKYVKYHASSLNWCVCWKLSKLVNGRIFDITFSQTFSFVPHATAAIVWICCISLRVLQLNGFTCTINCIVLHFWVRTQKRSDAITIERSRSSSHCLLLCKLVVLHESILDGLQLYLIVYVRFFAGSFFYDMKNKLRTKCNQTDKITIASIHFYDSVWMM